MNSHTCARTHTPVALLCPFPSLSPPQLQPLLQSSPPGSTAPGDRSTFVLWAVTLRPRAWPGTEGASRPGPHTALPAPHFPPVGKQGSFHHTKGSSVPPETLLIHARPSLTRLRTPADKARGQLSPFLTPTEVACRPHRQACELLSQVQNPQGARRAGAVCVSGSEGPGKGVCDHCH